MDAAAGTSAGDHEGGPSLLYRASKRILDVLLGSLGLVVASPLLAAGAVAVKLDSPGPVLHRGRRVGRHGAVFHIYKLRTMRVGADGEGPAVTAARDPRITRVGRHLRRTKLDELPQLLNVIRGEMSMVGPRPEHPGYVALYSSEQRRILRVRPGVTSPASLLFHDEESRIASSRPERQYIETILPAKLALDLDYIDHPTLTRDVALLVRTLLTVARSRG